MEIDKANAIEVIDGGELSEAVAGRPPASA